MSGTPVVSVVIIFLNAAQFLREAIESVLTQTYGNWELLLVDDGSSDGSTAIARGYATESSGRIRHLEHDGHQHRGMSASRNLGIRHARGEYIALLDADDVWLPHKLEHQVALLASHPEAALVYGTPLYWHSWTGDPSDCARDSVPATSVPPNTLVTPPRLLTAAYPLGTGNAPCPSDLLFRRALIERAGAFEDSFRGFYEDQAFLAKVYLKECVLVVDECWSRYRQHPGSCMSAVAAAGQYHAGRLHFLQWLEEYLSAQTVTDAEIWSALRAALWPYRHPVLSRLAERAHHVEARLAALTRRVARHTLPESVRRRLSRRWHRSRANPRVGAVNLGDLRRVTPISCRFGFDRGRPVDRYYIEGFLAQHAIDIRGRVLEIGDDAYTRMFGADRVVVSDVLHVSNGNAGATFVGDLARADHIPSDAFDCVILTQTLNLIYDVRAALQTLHRILKPGCALLATFPGISQVAHDQWHESWCWGFTTVSARRLFAEVFPAANVEIQAHGNVLAAIAFLHGLAVEELKPEELEHRDPAYEVLITARATKPEVA
jgi:glycosyltransferase involved in cell wall biosynthesis